MKNISKWTVGVCFGCILSHTALSDEGVDFSQPVDYLKLTRSSLPSARTIVSASYESLDFNLATFKERIRRVQQSALLPESVNFGYGYVGDGISDYGFYKRITTSTNNPSNNNITYNDTTQTQHGVLPNQFSTRESFSLSMRWDLQKLFGVDGEKINTLADVINQIDQEGFALGQIARSYGQLMSALPETSSTTVTEAKAFVILEHAAILDSLSGGLLTRVLMKASAEEVVVVNAGQAFEQKMKNVKASLQSQDSGVIEVRDGQDDGIEVIGGASN